MARDTLAQRENAERRGVVDSCALERPVGRRNRRIHRLDGFFDHIVSEHNFDFDLGEEVHDILGAAVELGVALLSPEALGLGDRNALKTNLLQRLLHFVEFERLDDRLDLFHRLLISPANRGRHGTPTANRGLAGPVPSRLKGK